MKDESIHLISQILDRELIDTEFCPCGKVDDVELKGEPGEPLRIVAILTGSGAWSSRLPALIRFIAEKIFGKSYKRIPWEEVKSIGSHIQLRSNIFDLGLIETDVKLAPKFRKMPKGA